MKKTKTLLMALALGFAANAYAQDTPTWGVKFNDVEIPFQDQAYVFPFDSTRLNTIEFNSALPKVDVKVPVIFSVPQGTAPATFLMIGNGSAQEVTYSAPISGYGADIELTTANGALGKTQFTSAAQAAFGSLTVDNAKVVLQNQVGITDSFVINQNGEVVLENGSTLLLTQRIDNKGTFTIKGVIDASNLSHEEATTGLGIMFEDLNGEAKADNLNGFLFGSDSTEWNINKSTEGTGDIDSQGGQLKVGTLLFEIQDGGKVQHKETSYEMWFQNKGDVTFSEVLAVAEGHDVDAPKMMLNGGESKKPAELTTLNIDVPVYSECMVYVAQDTGAKINFVDYIPDDPFVEESRMGGVGNFYAVDNSYTQITSFYGESGRMNMANFIGQNIVVEAVHAEDPEKIIGYDENNLEFSPLSMLVNGASSVKIVADIAPGYGYFEGRDIQTDQDYKIGRYDINGTLELASGKSFDLTSDYKGKGLYSSGNVSGSEVTDAVFNEFFVHLNIGTQGEVLLDENAVLRTNTFDDNHVTIDNRNVDTSRRSPSTQIDEIGRPIDNADSKYTTSGTVTILGVADQGGSTVTASKADAGHYTTRNYDYTVSNADIYFADQTADSTISNKLVNDSVYNYTEGKKITLDNDLDDTVSLREVGAIGGDIAITNKPQADTQVVHIGEGKTVSVTAHDEYGTWAGMLTVNDLLQADGTGSVSGGDGASKIDASLTLGLAATLDVHAAGGSGGIDMRGNIVQLELSETTSSGALTLSQGDYDLVWAMDIGEKYDLFYNVVGFFPDEVFDREAPFEITDLSNINKSLNGYFKLCYSGDSTGGRGNQVGTIYLVKTLPEPTTGTLSLLALAALAARRRRK